MERKYNFWEETFPGIVLGCAIFIVVVIFIVVLGGVTKAEIEHPTPPEKSYTEQTVDSLNTLKSPVILIGKGESSFGYSITVKDSNNKIMYFGNFSGLANSIGESRQIGDTIK